MSIPHYGDYQLDIYFDGLEGQLPKYPVDFASLEHKAAEALPSWVYSYVAGGCGDEGTQRANVDAFSRYGIVPRMLVGATERDLSVSLFDVTLPTPVFMAPIGVIGLCSQDFHGDVAVAKASAQTGVPMSAGTLTQDRMEDVIPHAGDTPALFQLYTPGDKDLAASFLARAEKAGYKAVVVTVDTWATGWRPRDLNTANFPFQRGYGLQNYFTDEVFLNRLTKSASEDPRAAALEWIKVFGNSLRWEDLGWLRSLTSLPMLLKAFNIPTTCAAPATTASTASTAPTTAAARPTEGCPHSKHCRPWSRPPTECRCCSMAACAAAPMWPRPWRWGPPLSGSAARTRMHWPLAARRASWPNCAPSSPSWTC